jgi:serine/threonine protein kinase
MDIQNEIRAIEILSQNSNDQRAEHVVAVLEHGWLPRSADYYVDMEICAYSLDAWIRNNEPLLSHIRSIPPPLLPRRLQSEFDDLREEAVSIVVQISKGLSFVHTQKLIHRDLNPRNSTIFFSFA